MKHVKAPTQVTLGVTNGGEFPVRRVYCVGRNYRAHAIVPSGSTLDYPPRTSDFQHEIELVVAIGKGGKDIPLDHASDHVFGYAVGLDMTRRDLQMEARKSGRPWDMGKGFDQSAPCGKISPVSETGLIQSGEISLTVNGETRQASDVSLLIWNVAEVIADLSTYCELVPGDLIFSGTPEGVGPVFRGDHLVGHIDGLTSLEVFIAK
jgi:fumarylpyruvate hydrolase